MRHYSVGLMTFVERLKRQLDLRVDMFAKHMRSQDVDGMADSSIKTEKEWMAEYLEWSQNMDAVQQEVLRYLTRSENEDYNTKG